MQPLAMPQTACMHLMQNRRLHPGDLLLSNEYDKQRTTCEAESCCFVA